MRVKMANNVLKLAIQKNGRLTDKSIELLKHCDIDIESFTDKLQVSAKNYDLEIILLRDDDIPEYVQDGVADIGIVGENVIAEKKHDVKIIKKLGFGKCTLMFAIPENKNLNDITEIEGKRIATSYPNIVNQFLSEHNIKAKIVDISGSVEVAPALGIADVICDIVSTGNTLRMNKLKKSFPVFQSEAALITSAQFELSTEKQEILDDLLKRINAIQRAQKSKYLMLNIDKQKLDSIIKIIPSLKSPTIVPLADENMVAVHAVVTTQQFWNISDTLKQLGATGIILLPIESIIP
jgi:ATP phosphoribosyltransferase